MLSLIIENEAGQYQPVVEDKIVWNLQRLGTPGKLTFSVLADREWAVSEGNKVCFHVDGKAVFYGFVFGCKRAKDGRIKITAYDQLRYLKNKDSYNYEKLTATQVIQMIADDFHLQTGDLAATDYVIPVRSEPDKTLFDIIMTALDLTMLNTRKIYNFYDDYGRLTLKDMESMKSDLIVSATSAEDFDYSSSIDGETYNQVKVSIDNKETGKKDTYIAQDNHNINQWGVLQYCHKEDNQSTGGQQLAEAYLNKYNQKTKKLSIKKVLGDLRVRAGSLIPINLEIGEERICSYLLVDQVSHEFCGNLHTMDLTLRGHGFYV